MAPVLAAVTSVSGAVGGLGGLAAAATVGSTLISAGQQRKAARLQDEAVKKQQQLDRLQVRRQRRQAIRQKQIARAQALNSAAGSGALQGSSIQGGLGSLSANLSGSLGFSTQGSGLSQQIGDLGSQANRAMRSANTFAGVSRGASGLADFGQLFGTTPSEIARV